MKAPKGPPIGRSEKMNVGVQRQSVNLKEAENLGEQATAVARDRVPPAKFSKHGTFSASPQEHMIESLWND